MFGFFKKRPNDDELSKQFVQLVFLEGRVACIGIAKGIEMTAQDETQFPVNDFTKMEIGLAILGAALGVLTSGETPLMTIERGTRIASACKLSIKKDIGLSVGDSNELNETIEVYRLWHNQLKSSPDNPYFKISAILLRQCMGKEVLALTYPDAEHLDPIIHTIISDLMLISVTKVLNFWVGK